MGAFSNINHNFFFYNNLEFLKDLKTISKILKLKFKIKLLMGCLIQLIKGRINFKSKKTKKK